MKITRKSASYIARCGIIASLYVAFTFVFAPISFGPVQFRLAEALTVLPILFPEAVPALAVGCAIANIASSFGWIDIVFGTLATLIAAIVTSRMKRLYLSPIPAVVANALIVGAVITYFETGALFGDIQLGVYLMNVGSLALSEALVCWGVGVPVLYALRKTGLVKKEEKQD